MKKTMICVAPNGAWASKRDNAATPISPAEIAAAVADAAKAGASIAHVHARTPEGHPTQDVAVYREIVDRIRERCDIVIQLSIGTRGFAIDEALEPVQLKPEMASFPLRVLRSAEDPDPLQDIVYMARKMTAAGVRPELDASTPEMIRAAVAVRDRHALVDPLCFGLILKEAGSARQVVKTVVDWSQSLPDSALWWVAKGEAFQREARAAAVALGGHVRVGFEDSILRFDGSGPAPSNAYLVEEIAKLVRAAGSEPATPAEARSIIGIGNSPA